jgi:hypothetical protein
MTRDQKASEILKANKAAERVRKARALSPAFDKECREAERPVGFWQTAGYVHGWLRRVGDGNAFNGIIKTALLGAMLALVAWGLIEVLLHLTFVIEFIFGSIFILFMWLVSPPRYRRRYYYRSYW